jgi:chaperonin GroES
MPSRAAGAQRRAALPLETARTIAYFRWHSPTKSANNGSFRFRLEAFPHIIEEDSMNFRPLHDRVLLRRVEQEEKTAGGIIIPDSAKEKPMEGEVIAVGPGARGEDGTLHPLDVKAGDRVLFGKWSGTEVKIDGEELIIMKESDIMGIVEGKPAAKSSKKVA